MKTDVLIIGAGPTGFSLACQLARFGVDFVILDQKEGVTPFSKALGVQARTLEIYDQLGLAQKAVEKGAISQKVRLLEGGETRAEFALGAFGKGLSPFPFLLFLPQSENEALLYGFLRERGHEVRWNTVLENFSHDANGVTAQISRGETIEARYLVGCDGPHSAVRHGLGLSFEGSSWERIFYVADAQIDWELPHDALQICLSRSIFTAFFPMPGEKRYRIIGTFPEGSHQTGEVLYEEIEAQIKREAQLKLEISDVRWFSTYKVHARRVNQFSKGRCFVAGDAAHIHSPAGAQGMNTGIGDAYNLAWKLAFVLRGDAAPALLDSYNEERLENAKHLLETTDRVFNLGAGSNPLLAWFRTAIFPHLAPHLIELPLVQKAIFPLISQIGINYRHSSLSDHANDGEFKIKAGDRMPYFQIDGASIYDFLKAPKFHLIAFGDEKMEWEGVQSLVLPLSDKVREIFGTSEPFQVLLRPDNYVARLGTRSANWRDYFSHNFGLTGGA